MLLSDPKHWTEVLNTSQLGPKTLVRVEPKPSIFNIAYSRDGYQLKQQLIHVQTITT